VHRNPCRRGLRPIDISGRLPTSAAAGDSYAVTARTTVADTSQGSRTAPDRLGQVLVGAAAPAPATGGVVLPLSMPLLVLIVVILLLGGGLLVGFAARRRSSRHSAHGERPALREPAVRRALAQSGSSCPRRSVRYMRSVGPTKGADAEPARNQSPSQRTALARGATPTADGSPLRFSQVAGCGQVPRPVRWLRSWCSPSRLAPWAHSSAEERSPYKREVIGSNPIAPTFSNT
jgi:uncharacterized protein YneF (UPF0154 family)